MWKDIANELGVPWRSAEAMHWAIGEQGMAQRANVTPFTMAAARAEPDEPASGRVAQRDRMLESTRVFEGQDLGTLNSSFSSVNANGNSHHYIPAGPYGIHPSTHVHIAPIKSENSFNGFDDEESQGDDEDDDGSKARKRRSGSGIRLPGLAQLDGEVQAIAKRERDGLVAADRYDGRRGSAASSGSSGSNGSIGTGGSG